MKEVAYIIILILVMVMFSIIMALTGCAYGKISGDRAHFWGWGKFKQGEAEIVSEPPIKIGNVGNIR